MSKSGVVGLSRYEVGGVMARMMGKACKREICWCWDCGGPIAKGRAREKQEWVKEAESEMQEEDD